MTHDELVELYLKEVARRGMRAGELLEVARSTTDLAATSFFDRCLTGQSSWVTPRRRDSRPTCRTCTRR